MTHPLQSASKINAPGTLAAPSGSDVRPETGQLSCPKCRALTVNVNASDIIRDNGYVTCSNCGHERQIRKLTGLERIERQGMIFNYTPKHLQTK